MEELRLSGENLYDLLDSLLKKKHLSRVKVICKGFSMSPFIKDSDSIIVKPVEAPENLRLGDIVVILLSPKKRVIIHRIIKIKRESFLSKGDNLIDTDGWFNKKKIIGIVEAIHKKNNFTYKSNPFINYILAIGSRTKILTHLLAGLRLLKKKHYA